MKRILLILALIAFSCSLCFAGTVVVAKKKATTAGCSSYSSYKFCWDGDHASGTTYAYTAGAALNGTNSGGTIGTDYGVTGNGFRKTANDQYICWTITGDDIFDDAEFTVWARIRASANRTAQAVAWEATANATPTQDDIRTLVGTTANNLFTGAYEGDSTEQGHNDSDVVVSGGNWVTVAYTAKQSITDTAQHCVSDNGAESWQCSGDEDLTLPNPATNEFCIGERRVGGGETTTDYVLDIDEVVIYATYKTAAPY